MANTDNEFAGIEFDSLFKSAEDDPAYEVSRAKLRFTEEMLARMNELGLTRTDLSERLGVKLPQISRLCSGKNNFTFDTVVRIARATESEFCFALKPRLCNSYWVHFSAADASEQNVQNEVVTLPPQGNYTTIVTSHNEPVSA